MSLAEAKPRAARSRPARSIAATIMSSEGSGIACFSSPCARSCNSPVSAPPFRSMAPPCGSGVLWPIPARFSAAVEATPIWPQVRTM